MLNYNIDFANKVVIVSGAAGFIGANLAKRLLRDYPELRVVGIDNITDYYDVQLKYERVEKLTAYGDRIRKG